jgi:PAS domain S-box-containing protein
MSLVTQIPAAFDQDRDLRFRAMFEGAAIGIGICRLDGGILEANPALSRMLGYSQKELAGTDTGELLSELRGDLSPRNSSSEHSASEHSASEQGLLGELMRGERDSIEIEKRCRRKDGSELWGDLTVSLGRDARRQPAFLIAMLKDATERKQVEEQLRQAEKMEVLGRLAGGIAHDFNNLLTGILLYCDLLSAGLASAELVGGESTSAGFESAGLAKPGLQWNGLRQQVGEVRLASEQGAALTQQLLAIARKQAAEPRAIGINEIVASSKNLLQRLVGEQIELAVVLDPALDSGSGLVLADPAQLRQILLNLVLNARDAMPQGGTIWLSTSAAEFPGEVFSKAEPASSRRAISLVVSDNGCGMDAETRARLFEPFFTTKLPGRGTGLGLATVQRIVTESGGTIEVESEPGHGTSVAVFFPAIESASSDAEGDGASPVSTDRS